MKKRLYSLLLALVMTAALITSAAANGFANFTSSGEYRDGRFRDVAASHWFAGSVEAAYNYGLIIGKSADTFDPDGYLTLGEAVKIVSRLHSIYTTGGESFTEGAPFYAVYADYAADHGFNPPGADYSVRATRAQLAELIATALPKGALSAINTVPNYAICDVVPGDEYFNEVYTLYRAGVLAGSDSYGTFRPADNITRAETCAIIERVIKPAKRLSVRLPDAIPASELFKRCSGAVFMLELFDEDGELIRTASGFFITDTGLAVTSEHIFADAVRAIVTLASGEKYPLALVHAISYEYDLAIISIDPEVKGIPHLSLADSDAIKAGQSIYALTSPLGLLNSMTAGVISHPDREVGANKFFQFTAPISFGSGGGPVLNTKGQVVGVASSSFTEGDNLNLAVPCNLIKLMKIGAGVTLEELPGPQEYAESTDTSLPLAG